MAALVKDQNIEFRGNFDGPENGNFDGNIEDISISVNNQEKWWKFEEKHGNFKWNFKKCLFNYIIYSIWKEYIEQASFHSDL